MQVKKDDYRAKQVGIMLSHETNPNETHYSANLSHWYGDSKTINIEADALALLRKAYNGEYVELNPLKDVSTGHKYHFWRLYQYEEENYPLFFVHLPNLRNRDIVEVLRVLDMAYGDTNQETTDWALEFQVLTRMLVREKSLLVNPLYLDLSQDPTMAELLEALPSEDRHTYRVARQMSQEEILRMHQEYEG